MTHRDFIAAMENHDIGKQLFNRYKEVFTMWKKPVLVFAGNQLHENEVDEHIANIEKQLMVRSGEIKKIADFMDLKLGDYLKVINYLEQGDPIM